MMSSRCLIVLSLVASAAGLKVKDQVVVEKKQGENFAPRKASLQQQSEKSFAQMATVAQKAWETAKDRLEEMHFEDAPNLKPGVPLQASFLVQTSRSDLQAALDALAPELKVDPKTSQLPSIREWFKAQGAESDYKDIMNQAALIPLDDESEQLAKEVGTSFQNIFMETSQKIESAGGVEKVHEKELKSILEKHVAGPKEKLKKFASTRPTIDVALIAMTAMKKVTPLKAESTPLSSLLETSKVSRKQWPFPPMMAPLPLTPPWLIPRNTRYDDMECTGMGFAAALMAQNGCLNVWTTPPMSWSLNATTNAALCIDNTHDFYANTCQAMGVTALKEEDEAKDMATEVASAIGADGGGLMQ